MDIALMSMALSQSQVQQQASFSVMNKVMDQAQVNADFIHKMMTGTDVKVLQHAAQPNLGGNIDINT
ncbi:putative motility protein [Robertmurraya kyonggiensis]|uniref:Putative motility protein n=1 Tax=Robertmurraya kyonggiensis TaxID=1037680 RepID=A0A4U1D7L2_9BACI|nr:putative motility protein [Robertmurraya kyonggiensis]TKC17046.1 putative motility protein [Robertmurraya kyonggiensis]